MGTESLPHKYTTKPPPGVAEYPDFGVNPYAIRSYDHSAGASVITGPLNPELSTIH